MTWKVSRQTQRWALLALMLVVCVAAGVSLVSAIVQARNAATRSQCKGLVFRWAFVLSNYIAKHGTIPAAISREVNSQTEASWRVELLRHADPFVVSDYRPDLPWNSPENLAVARKVEDWGIFDVPNLRHSRHDVTQVLAIRYPGGPWDAPLTEKTRLLPALALIPESTVQTLKPADITLDELKKLLATRGERPIPVYICAIDTHPRVATVEYLDMLVP
ncbi:MAG: hypothetical protein KF777_21325 [Planctomycetaceae bacterium]|nr:hypothetical protein [Planctomycetaceae bacterium]